jgi:hypothetical protein
MAWQALYQAVRFKKNKAISHNFHAWLYGGVSILVCLPFALWCGWIIGLKLLGIAALQRLALFDFILNFSRSTKPYLTYNGKGTTSSWQDRLENLLPEWALLPLKIAYIVIFVLYTTLIK